MMIRSFDRPWFGKQFRQVAIVLTLGSTAFIGGHLSMTHADDEATRVADVLNGSNEEKSMSFWMEKKLDYSQAILRGLATADFELVEKNAKQMRALSKIEGFVRRRSADYQTQLHTFERVTDDLIRHAQDKNIEGLTLRFNQLTMSCVSCHESLREPTQAAAAGEE